MNMYESEFELILQLVEMLNQAGDGIYFLVMLWMLKDLICVLIGAAGLIYAIKLFVKARYNDHDS